MRKALALSLALLLLTGVCSCQHDDPLAPAPSTPMASFQPDVAAKQAVDLTSWSLADDPEAQLLLADLPAMPAEGVVLGMTREVLDGDVVHTSFDVAVGDGMYDVIRLHRIVREDDSAHPLRAKKNVFLLHGDGVGFVKFVFGSATPALADDYSVAVFLAQNGVDVWGMDQNWAIVPAGLTDLSFSAGWGMQNQVDNLRAGIAVARGVRALTGSGPNKMNVLGYSSGGYTVYALANEETQSPPAFRQMAGMVIADAAYNFDPARFPNESGTNCDAAEFFASELANGVYDLGFGGFFLTAGSLAKTDPDGPSPFEEGLTNLEFVLAAGAFPDPNSGASPWYHFWGGVFVDDFPVDFAFSKVDAVVDFFLTASPFEPVAFGRDYASINCDEIEVPFDDHLAEIRIPALLLGAAGGFGETGLYTLGLLGSKDTSAQIVSVAPPEEIDLGHIDLWTADNARDLVWRPLLEWLEDHVPRAGGPVKWKTVGARI